MKKKVKTSLSMFLVATLLLAPTSVTVYGADTSKIVSTEVAEEETYFIKDDASLWKSNQDGTFVKISDNVLAVYPESDFGDCAYITTDNTFMIYEYIASKDKGVISEVAKDVKEIEFTDYEMYYLTTSGELYQCTLKYKNHFDNSFKFKTELIAEDVQEFSTDSSSLWYIDSDNALWFNEYMYYQEDTTKILENVKDVKSGTYSTYVLDLDGNLYYIDDYYWSEVEITDENIIATDVKDLEIVVVPYDYEEYLNVFIIKNDNSLWGKGTNTHGQFGVGFGTSTKDFAKIADNVVDVDTSAKHTTYVTKDGKLWGMGNNNNGQLGKVVGDKIEKFNEEGFVEIATGVESADLFYDITTYRLADGSLWGLGENYDTVISDSDDIYITEPTLIAEDVKWWNNENTGDTLPYVVGEDRELYFRGMHYALEIGTYYQNSDINRRLYEFYFEELGLDITYDYYLENKEEVEKLMYKASDKLTEEELEAFDEKELEFGANLVKEFNSKPVAKDVVQSSEEYFVDTNNDLYIIDENNNTTKIRSDVKEVFTEDEYVFILDTKGKLYFADAYEYVTFYLNYQFEWEDYKNDLELGDRVVSTEYVKGGTDVTVMRKINNLNFLDTGVSGVTQIEGVYDKACVLKNDGTLIVIENLMDYIYMDDDGEYTGKVQIEYADYDYRELAEDFEDVDIQDDVMYYGYEGKYSTYWSGYLDIYDKKELLNLDGYTLRITEIANGVKNFNVNYDQLVYVDKNDVLWGKGDNTYSQLVSNGVEYYDEFIKIADDVKMADVDGDTLILLKNDGTLIGRGLNNFGELGLKEIGFVYDISNVLIPKQIQ